MQDIYIYFHNNQIYKLDDMHIIAKLPNSKQETIYRGIRDLKNEYNIKLAIIGFNQPIRNTVYSLFPMANIIINPLDVINMINYHLGYSYDTVDIEQEIAIGLEENQIPYQSDMVYLGIYNSRSKNEAIYYYTNWQSFVPLKTKCFHHIIRKIDFYYDEIFNYFDFRHMIDLLIRQI